MLNLVISYQKELFFAKLATWLCDEILRNMYVANHCRVDFSKKNFFHKSHKLSSICESFTFKMLVS